MDCYCGDADPPEFVSSKIRTRRNQCRCYECSGLIKAGEKYEYVAGSWGGNFNTFTICERCFDIRQYVTNQLPCFCWYYGSMLSDAAEHIEECLFKAPEEMKGVWLGYARLRVKLRKHNRINR